MKEGQRYRYSANLKNLTKNVHMPVVFMLVPNPNPLGMKLGVMISC